MTSIIEFIDQTINETKNINENGYHLLHRARKTIIASKGKYKINKINKISIILESEIKKHVINTYWKMQIPMMWRNFFKNIFQSRHYVYNNCNSPYKKFDRYCVVWYMYNLIKNNTDEWRLPFPEQLHNSEWNIFICYKWRQ